MKRLSSLMLIALGFAVFAVSCKSGGDSNVHVPKDAAVVVHINNSSLSTKLTWQEIQATDWFKDLYNRENDSLIRKMLDNPDNSGIDTKADMIFYIRKLGRGSYLAFEGTLKDAKAFEAFNAKMDPNASAAKSGDGSVMKLKDGALVYWEGTKLVYVADMPIPDYSSISSGGNYEPYKLPQDSLQSYAKYSLTVKGDESLGSDPRFNSLLAEGGDLHLWMNNDQYLSALGAANVLGMMKAADLIKGNVSAITASFDNGKINIDSKAYMNQQLTDLFQKYRPKKISADIINRIPSKDVVAVMAMNYPPEGLKELIKLAGLDGVANDFLTKANYSINDFIKANKGDVVVAISDFSVTTKEVTYPSYDGGEPFKTTQTAPDAKFLFATSINDKAAFDKLITTLSKEAGDIPKQAAPTVTYQLNNDWFVAGNSADYNSKFMAGGNSNLPFAGKLADKSFGMFVDFQKLMKGSQSSMKDTIDREALDASIKVWEDLVAYSGDFKDGGFTSHFEINLVDKSVNSLKQLNQYANTLFAIDKKRSARYKVADMAPDSQVIIDSATVVAPPAPAN